MEKCYVVMWDNGAGYEDSRQGIKCVCKTKEAASTLARRLNDKIEEDCAKIDMLIFEGNYKKTEEILSDYESKIDYIHLEDVSFYVTEVNYYDE